MKKALLATVVLATMGYGGYRLLFKSGGDAQQQESIDDSKLALDRIWIDHIPRSERDTIQVFAAVSEEEFGVFQATSAWKGAFELFRFDFRGDTINAVFPQDGDKEQIKVKARRCSESQMDFCMEVTGSKRGVKKYYSREGWEIDNVHSQAALERRGEQIVDELEAGLPESED